MTVKQYLNKLKKYRERQHKKTAVLLMLSLFVIAGVSWSLHLTGESTAPDLYCNNTESSHTHTLSCYSNPDADIETNDDWEKSISGVTLTDVYKRQSYRILVLSHHLTCMYVQLLCLSFFLLP